MLPRLRASLLLALCALPCALSAQYFTIGTDPASVKWNQIKTPHFKVIYPEIMDSQAMRLANTLEYYRSPGSASLEAEPGKWPVIIHARSVVSNATTPYAPKRIDILTTPPQDNYGQNWLDQLVIHEFRHSTQYAATNQGFTKAMTWFFGQQAVPAVMGLFVPFWFIEGDAVSMETATSRTGRGRVPSFEMKLRAQFLEKGIFSYDKAYNGSYQDFIPDWYELGYLLVGHSRLEFGKETWSAVMRKTGKIPLMLVPFSNTLYKETGYGKSRLYGHITSGLQQSWTETLQNNNFTAFLPVITSEDNNYTNRTQPSSIAGRRVIARKSSLDDITRIVMIDSSGHENILVSPGYMPDECLSASSNLVCWAEMDQDPRWSLRSYSVIMVHDLQTGQTGRISKKSRYFAPDLDNTGQKIAAVETDESGHNSLMVLDASDGEIMHQFPTPENYFPSYPAWSSDGKKIAVILTREEGKCIAIHEPATGKYEIVHPFSNFEISKPCFFGDYLLFTGAYTGVDNIFALDIKTKKLYQVTSARFGATDAAVSPDGTKIYYSNYTANGYEIVSSVLDNGTMEQWKEWDPKNNYKYRLAEQLAAQEDFIFNSEDVPDSAYTIKPYRKVLNLFNPHSWAPLSIDIEHMDINPGVTLLSQNLLGTSYTTIGYAYNMNEKTGKYSLKYSYEGWYPAFDLETDYGLRRGTYQDTTYYDYDELNLGGWARVPLNWNVNSWFVGMQPYLGYSYKLLTMNPGQELNGKKLKFTKDRYNSLNSVFYFYAQSRMSERDLNPRWLQRLEVNYRQTLFEDDTISSIFSTEINLYFPGFARHHSFVFYGGYQERLIDEYNYSYSDRITIPRGYSMIYSNQMISGSVNYELPLFYPDWSIGPVLYLKRIKTALFFDQAWAFDTHAGQTYQSAGLDITFDFHLFRLFVPLEAGLRTIYFPQSKTVGFEFLYSMDLIY